ncbi:MAG: PEGA domain-containing protein [Phycisphaerales bacterium]|nr:PEGA domain-containing protein [Phycisphaerales bacterium]
MHRTVRLRQGLACAAVWVGVLPLCGCVRRTMTITTEPQGALVYLNDQEVGRSNVTVDFTWYGDYDVVLRKEGCKTLATHWKLDAPWHQHAPFDFFTEILWPGKIVDARAQHFVLEPEELPTAPDLQSRAFEMRTQTLGLDRAENEP